MQNIPPGQIYTERKKEIQASISVQNRRINILSLSRLGLLVMAIYTLVRGLSLNLAWLYLTAGISFLGFFILVIIYSRQKSKRELLRETLRLNQQELSCLEHEFGELPDGKRFADSSHPWTHDLDLFGEGSLFQYMNRCGSAHGESELAGLLSTIPAGEQEIKSRQELIKDLAGHVPFRQEFTSRGRLLNPEDDVISDIQTWSHSEAYISRHPWLWYLALVVSATSIGIFISGLFDGSRFWYLLYILFLNFGILSFFMMRTGRYQRSISKKTSLLQSYADRLRCIKQEEFIHPEWQKARETAYEGCHETAKLSRLLGMFDQRLNLLMGIVLNGLFLYDFHMLYFLERWKKRNGKRIMEWISLVNHMDAMNSLAGFAFNHPANSYPDLAADAPFEIKELGHPLIRAEKRINNDLELSDEKIVVITGANMAGKSTFLRSLGINLVLAYTGCPVCASHFSMPFTGLYSSMRTADSLKDEESYFLAEIRRLGTIVKEMEEGRPMLILLDEVLKGTNTTDKKLGSIGLIEKALNYPVHCFIATHDLSLGELEQQHKRVISYCFESYIKDMELSFDYRIRPGIATNMNASFLMRKMGIMD